MIKHIFALNIHVKIRQYLKYSLEEKGLQIQSYIIIDV